MGVIMENISIVGAVWEGKYRGYYVVNVRGSAAPSVNWTLKITL
jgi:hypothetical protein